MDIELGEIQEQFAEIIWENEPVASGELVKIAKERLDWKKSTTYTVLSNAINSLQLNRNISKSPESRNYSGFLPVFSISPAGTNLTIL